MGERETGYRSGTGWRERWAMDELVIRHVVGLANAPDDPVGELSLELTRAGELRLTRTRSSHGSDRWTASVDRAVVERVLDILEEGGFPDVPHVGFPPGPSFRVLELRAGDRVERVFLARSHYEYVDPWAELTEIMDALCVQCAGPLPGLKNILGRAVHGVRREGARGRTIALTLGALALCALAAIVLSYVVAG